MVVDLVNDEDNDDDGEDDGNRERVDDGGGYVVLVTDKESEDSVGIGKDQGCGVTFGVANEDVADFIFGVLVTFRCFSMDLLSKEVEG